ncbi:metalloprotease (Cop-G1L) [Mythimna separata entomopoxvirus 'L']|uniref:Metalloprotease (Cop-G1L) n=1 Tax=Mythimna separata entomopoxvirus 'L' TaxID=1293572 RepID=A0A916KQ05_9POXV|nr:metalloprotease (Cop-G1L) [Mythimna separata entomopoxvirus 'L']CCU56225.1 metalloprotease (Cop-G1L) [Mythimna separata entomopoxvirus 'L']
MKKIILDNGIQLIYHNFNNNLIDIIINNLGEKISLYYKKYKLTHFIEHVMVLILEIYTGKYSDWNGSTYISFMNIFYNNTTNISYDTITDAILKLFNKNGLFIDKNVITSEMLSKENQILINEKSYRILTNKYFVNPILYLLTNDLYLEGTNNNIIDIEQINNILQCVDLSDICINTSNIDIFSMLSNKLNKLSYNKKNKNKIKYELEFPIVSSKIPNSIFIFSFNNSKKYSITVKFNLFKYVIIGYMIDKYYFNKNIILSIYFDKIASITQFFISSEDMYKSIYLSKIDSTDNNLQIYNLLYEDYAVLNKYIDIVNIYKDICLKKINKYIINYNKYTTYIQNSTKDINKLYLTIPNELYLNNEIDINHIPVYKSETIFDTKINLSNYDNDYKFIYNYISIPHINNNNIYFLNSNEKNFIIKNDKIVLNDPVDIYMNNSKIYTINNNYNNPKILFYYKFFILYFLTNQFLDINKIIDTIKFKRQFELYDSFIDNRECIYFIDNIEIDNKIININTDYNFVAVLYNHKLNKGYINIYLHITNISNSLRNKGLIYTPMINTDKDYIYIFLITNDPIKTENYIRNILNNQFKITKIISIISNIGIFNASELPEKTITFK